MLKKLAYAAGAAPYFLPNRSSSSRSFFTDMLSKTHVSTNSFSSNSGERVLAKRIVSGLRCGPLPRQPDLVRRPKILDSCYEQAVQRIFRYECAESCLEA